MSRFIVQEEARCLLSNYIDAESKEEALEKFHSWEVEDTELDEILDTIVVYDDEVINVEND